MATVSQTNHPYSSQFKASLSGSGSGTFNQTFATVPTGKVLIITQFQATTGAGTIVINYINNGGVILPVNFTPVNAGDILQGNNNYVLGPGTYTLNNTLGGSYGWVVTGYYATTNT